MTKKFSIISEKQSGILTLKEVVSMKAPRRLPKEGDILEVVRGFRTPRPEYYVAGDKLEIIGRTKKNPHNTRCTLGNLLVRGKDGEISVWSNIEWGLVDGTFKYT